MTYTFADFWWLLAIGWILVFLMHAAIGGLLSIFYRRFSKDHLISIFFK